MIPPGMEAMLSDDGTVNAPPPDIVQPDQVLPLLAQLDALPSRATGALTFGGAGAILLDEGRICWAVASPMKRRLTDLLRGQTEPPTPRETMEDIYVHCKTDATPLGQELLRRGLVTEDGLKSTLHQHNAEAIFLLSQGFEQLIGQWVEHRLQGYDAQFTFTTAQVLASVGAMRSPHAAGAAQAELERVLSMGGTGAAFVRERFTDAPYPVALVRGDDLAAHDLVELGSWAVHQIDATEQFGDRCGLAWASFPNGASTVVWEPGPGLTFAALCPTRAELGKAMKSLHHSVGR